MNERNFHIPTPLPWSLERDGMSIVMRDQIVATAIAPDGASLQEQQSNARRLVASANALAEFDIDDIESMDPFSVFAALGRQPSGTTELEDALSEIRGTLARMERAIDSARAGARAVRDTPTLLGMAERDAERERNLRALEEDGEPFALPSCLITRHGKEAPDA